jgi:hypothetical protein
LKWLLDLILFILKILYILSGFQDRGFPRRGSSGFSGGKNSRFLAKDAKSAKTGWADLAAAARAGAGKVRNFHGEG